MQIELCATKSTPNTKVEAQAVNRSQFMRISKAAKALARPRFEQTQSTKCASHRQTTSHQTPQGARWLRVVVDDPFRSLAHQFSR
jgi:hypothetical protein